MRFRVFISSPGDVSALREIAAETVERIAPDYLRSLTVEPYLWETEPLVARGHFQDVTELPSTFDVVVIVLWSRLGSPLPARTSVRAYTGLDGRTPVTGTEWEFEEALKASRATGKPDILVYRSRAPVPVDNWNVPARAEQAAQFDALSAFWTRHFSDGDRPAAAYHEFTERDEFRRTLESHLRRLIARRIESEGLGGRLRGGTTPGWGEAPYRGLLGFDAEHAAIYFGRSAASGRALGRLLDNAASGCAFLLVLGASGAGKSSLAKAGLWPRLSVPRRVRGARFVRQVSWRPTDQRPGEDAAAALARTLSQAIDPDADASPLAAVIRHAPGTTATLVATHLDATFAPGARIDAAGPDRAALLLIVDQLEELFTDPRIAPIDRTAVITALEALAGGGRVFVVGTMRSDLWHRAAEEPRLLRLADGLGRIDLEPPQLADVTQMIRLPAEVAGIRFEIDPYTGSDLGDVIAEAAMRAPDALPLLSHLLEQLYEADIRRAGGTVLTAATYARLGGLEGAIAARAEAVLAAQPVATAAELRSVMLALVQANTETGGGTTLTARRARLEDFGAGTPARELVEAFLAPDARLLVADDLGGGAPFVRLAHEALLTGWTRLRDLLAEDRHLLAIRRNTEDRHARWRQVLSSAGPGPAARRGLLTNLDLEDGRRLVASYGGALSPDLAAYIALSAKAARRRAIVLASAVAAVALGFTVLIGAAGWNAYEARRSAEAAERNAYEARRSAEAASMADMARELVNHERDGDAFVRERRYDEALTSFQQSAGYAARLAAAQPDNPRMKLYLAQAHARLGYVHMRLGTPADITASQDFYRTASAEAAAAGRSADASPETRRDAGLLARQLGAQTP